MGAAWVHLDVADGVFSPAKLWDTEEGIDLLKTEALPNLPPLILEVHLMVEHPERWVSRWLSAGAKRVIVHCETVQNLDRLKEECAAQGAELGIAIAFSTDVKSVVPFIERGIEFVLVLSVPPGYAGQTFREDALKKIEWLNKRYPGILIEVDGGIDEETARQTKAAGADVLVSATYLFGALKPRDAYRELRKV